MVTLIFPLFGDHTFLLQFLGQVSLKWNDTRFLCKIPIFCNFIRVSGDLNEFYVKVLEKSLVSRNDQYTFLLLLINEKKIC